MTAPGRISAAPKLPKAEYRQLRREQRAVAKAEKPDTKCRGCARPMPAGVCSDCYRRGAR